MSLIALALSVVAFACRDATAPTFPGGRLRHGSLDIAGPVVVSPGNMHGWMFVDDQHDAACSDMSACHMVQGPASPTLGPGSAQLATPLATDGKALLLQAYQGTRLDSITDLHYATYRQSADPGNNLAIALQLNVDYDLTDQAAGYQGRLVYEPYQGVGGNVPQNTWQTWDAKAGKWWGTKASVPVNGVLMANPCVQSTPCTWTQLLATFPNIGVHATYGAIVLKAGSNWAGFRGNVDALSIGVGGVTTTFDFELSDRAAVPATAPDSVATALWDSVTAPANILDSPPGITGHVIRDIIYVQFKPGATQSERETAIASINGQVIGGMRLGAPEHFYAVRLPYALTPGDSSSGPILRALAALHSVASVQRVLLALMDPPRPLYRMPTDGTGFTSWDLSPDSARGDNWGLTAVDAPMAWGCVTGEYPREILPQVAVVDEGFFDEADLHQNLGATQEFGPATGAIDHGTSVAAITGAVGDNSTGITGVMWKASLNLFDIRRPQPGRSGAYIAMANIGRAIESGARIINISSGIDWHGRIPNTPSDSQTVLSFRDAFSATMAPAWPRTDGLPPTLFVVAAGNDGINAWWSGYPAVATDSGDRSHLLVVGGTELTGTGKQAIGRSNGEKSNSDSLVDLVAPGWNIITLGHNRLVSASGTSFAAPFVTGVAAMLLAFDETTTTDSLRSFILQGARNGGRSISDPLNPTRPLAILNAYEALKQSARRASAPLCGNRVMKSFDGIYAMRGLMADRIIPLGIQSPDSGNAAIDVYHGSKRIDIGWDREFVWKAGLGFVEQSPYVYPDDLLDGGTFLSGQTTSHEYTVSGYLSSSSTSGTAGIDSVWLTVRSDQPTQTLTVARDSVVRPTDVVAVGRVPDRETGHDGLYVNTNWTYVGTWTEPRNVYGQPAAAMAPSGRYAIVAVNSGTTTITANHDFTNCRPPDPASGLAAQCGTGTVESHTDHVDLYRVDFAAKTSRWIAGFPGIELAWIALTEREDEIVWQTVVHSNNSGVRWRFQAEGGPTYGSNVDSVLTDTYTCTNKRYEYHAFDRSVISPNPIGAMTSSPTEVMDGCDNPDHSYLGATVSPSRIPSAIGGTAFKLNGTGPRSNPMRARLLRRARGMSRMHN